MIRMIDLEKANIIESEQKINILACSGPGFFTRTIAEIINEFS